MEKSGPQESRLRRRGCLDARRVALEAPSFSRPTMGPKSSRNVVGPIHRVPSTYPNALKPPPSVQSSPGETALIFLRSRRARPRGAPEERLRRDLNRGRSRRRACATDTAVVELPRSPEKACDHRTAPRPIGKVAAAFTAPEKVRCEPRRSRFRHLVRSTRRQSSANRVSPRNVARTDRSTSSRAFSTVGGMWLRSSDLTFASAAISPIRWGAVCRS